MITFETTCTFCGSRLVRASQASMYFCSTECKASWQRLAKPVTEEWLRDAYISKGMNCTEIAHKVGRDPKSVWNWLKDFGIPTRPRGSNWRQLPTDGFKGRTHSVETKEMLRRIAIADGRVPFDPSVGSYMKGRKGKDTPNWKGGLTPERQEFYATQEWKDAVKAVWKRDKCCCVICSKNVSHKRGETAIHHIESFANKKKRAKVSNLILLCKPCHLWVHSNANKNKDYIK